MGTPYVSAFKPNGADAMLLDNGNWFAGVWENTKGYVDLASIQYAYDALAGQRVCMSGSYTGTKCSGAVVVPDECYIFNHTDPDLDQTYQVNMCDMTRVQSGERIVQNGDSGGPVFYGNPADGVGATGIISAGTDSGTTAWYANRSGLRANFIGDFASF